MALSSRRFAICAGRISQAASNWSANALLDHDHDLTPDDVKRFSLSITDWLERMAKESGSAVDQSEALQSNENTI